MHSVLPLFEQLCISRLTQPVHIDPRVANRITDTVRDGATVLDRAYPGWHHKIDVTTLDISCLYSCALGQLYGDWTTGLLAMPADVRAWPGGYGFTGGSFTTRAWVHLIIDRCAAEQETVAAQEKELVNA